MKTNRLLTTLVCIASFAMGSNAKTIYCSYNGSNNNDGSSWAQAYLTPDTARARSVAGDNIWLQGDVDGLDGYNVYTFKSSTPGDGKQAFQTGDVNWYGGFKGDETAVSQRQIFDNDGNGIVEPWEFKYPTKITFDLSNSALALTTGATAKRVIDGLTLYPGEYRLTTTFGDSKLMVIGFNVVLKNSIIKNANYTVTESTGNSTLRPFMWVRGQMDYCLWENNTISVSWLTKKTQYGILFDMDYHRAATYIPTTVTNCVFRNNTGVLDGSVLTDANIDTRGVLFFINCHNGNLAGTVPDVFANNMIYNNDVRFIAPASSPQLSAGILGTSWGNGGVVGSPASATVMNNVFANNKLTNIKTPGIVVSLVAGTLYPTVVNNVFYNNKKYYATTLQDATLQTNVDGGNISTANVFNNFTTDKALWWGLTTEDNTAAGNGTFLAAAAKFVSPTTVVGYSDLVEVTKANWSLQTGSTLVGKGTASSYNAMVANAYTKYSTDFSGRPFAAPRSVGAFEDGAVSAVIISGLKNTTITHATFVLPVSGGLSISENGNVQIVSVLGQTIKSERVEAGQVIDLIKGIYLVRLQSAKGLLVQKVIL